MDLYCVPVVLSGLTGLLSEGSIVLSYIFGSVYNILSSSAMALLLESSWIRGEQINNSKNPPDVAAANLILVQDLVNTLPGLPLK
jgi:hypothetical protein